MSTSLENKLNVIYEEKMEKIKPENIKKGVTIFGVEGNAEGGSAENLDTELTEQDETLDVQNALLKELNDSLDNKVLIGAANIELSDGIQLFASPARRQYMNEFLAMCKNITSTRYMFSTATELTELDLTELDLSNVTDTSYMFSGCANLTSIIFGDYIVDKVATYAVMFSACRALTDLDLSNFYTDNAINVGNMFGNCSALVDLDLSHFDFSKVQTISGIFINCTNLTNLKSFTNLGKGYTTRTASLQNYTLDLSTCKLLTHDSLMSVINNLYDLNLTYDVANGGTLYSQKLILGTDNLAKLSENEIKIATDKGWTVS